MRIAWIVPLLGWMAISYFFASQYVLFPLVHPAQQAIKSALVMTTIGSLMGSVSCGLCCFALLIQQWKTLIVVERLWLFVGGVVPLTGIALFCGGVLHDLMTANWGH